MLGRGSGYFENYEKATNFDCASSYMSKFVKIHCTQCILKNGYSLIGKSYLNKNYFSKKKIKA